MVKSISAAVGKKGKNAPQDVRTVQELLNGFTAMAGYGKLKIDGQPSSRLNDAIGKFQREVCHFRKIDFTVDPGKTTLKKLNAGPSKLKSEQKSEAKRDDKLKEANKAKVVQQVRKSAEKEARKQKLDEGSWAAFFKSVEDQALALYDQLFGDAQSKGEPAPKAAPKIAAQVAKTAQKTAAEAAKKQAKSSDAGAAGSSQGKVTGKVSGVNKTIIKILTEVSAFYGKPIHVVSGLRDKGGQARAMYGGWNGHLKHGKIYIYLRGNEKLRLELDEFRQNKDRDGFVNHMKKNADWKRVSRHLSGDAVDVTLRTEKTIIRALATCLKYLPEKNSEGLKCHHFDTRKVVWPIKDSVKAKWKK